MLKKHLIIVMLMVMAVVAANAGTWKIHNYYVTGNIQNAFDVGEKVYYLNSKCLFEFDKVTLETKALNSQNVLSDSYITQIYYDYNTKLLFVTYANSNIDVIDEQGNVRNVSGIKDAIIRAYNFVLENDELSSYASKEISDITFNDGVAYVTIGFGYVAIDESTLEITQCRILGRKVTINSVAFIGDKMIILSNGNCYYGPADEENPISQFPRYAGTYTGGRLFPIDDHSAFVMGTSALYHFDFSTTTPTVTQLASLKASCVQRTPTGFIANGTHVTNTSAKYYYIIDSSGKTATLGNNAASCATSNPEGDGTIWECAASGLHIRGNSTYYKINSITTDGPYWLKYSPAWDKLFVGVTGPNLNTVTAAGTVSSVVNTYDGMNWADATAYSITGAGWEFVFNPLEPTVYVRASWTSGVYKVSNKTVRARYTSSNSLVGTYKAHPAFDIYGNMWVCSSFGNASCPVAVLPKDKVALNNNVTKSDWFQPSGLLSLNTGSMQRSRFLVSKKNNAKIYSDCDYNSTQVQGRIICWDNGNEDPTVDTYRLANIAHFTDQNNQQVDWTYLTHMEEDNEGQIWVCHTSGLFVFYPETAFDTHPMAFRPVVTTAASIDEKGILCEGYTVYDVGVDRDNNKWIASNNGVYHVSPDGSELFDHFTTYNSDVPSNTVYSIECDTVNNRVYIFTDNGFAEYVANGDAAALNFDNVYAFPSPVEPDYTGMIKIANLMDNSYVTITDHDGNIVAQMGPVMGCAFWDGSDASGNRVPTGTYNIFAAQGGQPATAGTPHATVMIIK